MTVASPLSTSDGPPIIVTVLVIVLAIGGDKSSDAFESLRIVRRIIDADLPPPQRGVHSSL